MSRPVVSKWGLHFLGNSNGDKELHDLYSEKSQCQTATILVKGHGVAFTPDTKEQAYKEGYDNCAYCIGGSKR